jgi:hypothetical protein
VASHHSGALRLPLLDLAVLPHRCLPPHVPSWSSTFSPFDSTHFERALASERQRVDET